MKKDGRKGNSTQTGKAFEDRLGIAATLIKMGFGLASPTKSVVQVQKSGKTVGYLTKGRGFYHLLDHLGISRVERPWEFRPDEVFLNLNTKTVYILELKTQTTKGSVDEKLFGVAYRVDYFKSFFEESELKVEFKYVLAGTEFYQKREGKYRDLFRYIVSSDADYIFEQDFNLRVLGI